MSTVALTSNKMDFPLWVKGQGHMINTQSAIRKCWPNTKYNKLTLEFLKELGTFTVADRQTDKN